MCIIFTYSGCYAAMRVFVYETKIHDIDDLQKRLMQTWFGFEQAVSDTAIDQWRD